MNKREKTLIAKLVQRKGKNGIFMRGFLEGEKLPIVLFKSDYEFNEQGEVIWNLYIDK